jgi:hypothetical protein
MSEDDEAPPRPDEAPEEAAKDESGEELDPRHAEGSAQRKAPADRPQPQATGHPENAG